MGVLPSHPLPSVLAASPSWDRAWPAGYRGRLQSSPGAYPAVPWGAVLGLGHDRGQPGWTRRLRVGREARRGSWAHHLQLPEAGPGVELQSQMEAEPGAPDSSPGPVHLG